MSSVQPLTRGKMHILVHIASGRERDCFWTRDPAALARRFRRHVPCSVWHRVWSDELCFFFLFSSHSVGCCTALELYHRWILHPMGRVSFLTLVVPSLDLFPPPHVPAYLRLAHPSHPFIQVHHSVPFSSTRSGWQHCSIARGTFVVSSGTFVHPTWTCLPWFVSKRTCSEVSRRGWDVCAHAVAMADTGGAYVGRRIATFWDDEQAWYVGTVVRFDARSTFEYHVQYDDGDEEGISFRVEDLANRGKVLTEPGEDEAHGVRKYKWIEDGRKRDQTGPPPRRRRRGEDAELHATKQEPPLRSERLDDGTDPSTKKRKKQVQGTKVDAKHARANEEEHERHNGKNKKKNVRETIPKPAKEAEEARRTRQPREVGRKQEDASASERDRNGAVQTKDSKPKRGGEGTDGLPLDEEGKPTKRKKQHRNVQTGRSTEVAKEEADRERGERSNKDDASPTQRIVDVEGSSPIDREPEPQRSSSSSEWTVVAPKKKTKKGKGSAMPEDRGHTPAQQDTTSTPATEQESSAKAPKTKKATRPTQKAAAPPTRKANIPGLQAQRRTSQAATDRAQTVVPVAKVKKPTFSLGNVLKNLEGGDVPEKEHKPVQSEPKVDERQKASILYEFLGRLANLSDKEEESLVETAQFMIDNANGAMAGKLVENFTQHIETEKKFQRKNVLLHLMDSVLQRAWSNRDKESTRAAHLLSEGFSKNLARIVDAAAPPGREARENRATLHRFLTIWKDQRYLDPSSTDKGIAIVFDLIRADKNALSFNPNREQRSLNYHRGLVNPTAGNVEGADKSLLAGIDGYGSVFSMPDLNGISLNTPSVDFETLISEEQDGIRTDAQVTFPDDDPVEPSTAQPLNRAGQTTNLPLNGATTTQSQVSTGRPMHPELGVPAQIYNEGVSGNKPPESEAPASMERLKCPQKRPGVGGSVSTAAAPREGHAGGPGERMHTQTSVSVFKSERQPSSRAHPVAEFSMDGGRSVASKVQSQGSPPRRFRDKEPRGPSVFGNPHGSHGPFRTLPKLYSLGDIDEERRRRYFGGVGRSTAYDQHRLDRAGPMASHRASRWEVSSGGVPASMTGHPRRMHPSAKNP